MLAPLRFVVSHLIIEFLRVHLKHVKGHFRLNLVWDVYLKVLYSEIGKNSILLENVVIITIQLWE